MVSLSYSLVNDWGLLPWKPPLVLAQFEPAAISEFFAAEGPGRLLLNILGAVAVLIVGWIIATIVASIVKSALNRTTLDNRLATMILGQDSDQTIPVEQWIAAAIYWLILLITVIGALNALALQEVSRSLSQLLDPVLEYLPRLGGAVLLLAVAWAVATIVKTLVVQGLARFNLDDQLAQQAGEGGSPFLVNETVGNILYGLIFLVFAPFILNVLFPGGIPEPIQSLFEPFLGETVPSVLYASAIAVVGWFVAGFVRNLVTNFLRGIGVDRIGSNLGLSTDDSQGGTTVSTLVGTIAYVLILFLIAVEVLRKLGISEETIPDPTFVWEVIGRIFAAGLVLYIAYVIGRLIAELVTSFFRRIGFDNILNVLGLPELSTSEARTDINAEGQPEVRIEPATKTPSEIIGLLALVGVLLLGAAKAAEIIDFPTLTGVVEAILLISARILSGVAVFAVGLYFANLAFRLIRNMGIGQANFLAQAARVAIITLAAAMGIQQMGVALSIVNLAFGLLVGAVAVAFAIAFGLGGRDVAAEELRDWLNTFKRQ